jgi:hypothetical protein
MASSEPCFFTQHDVMRVARAVCCAVHQAPQFTKAPTSAVLTEGERAEFVCQAKGKPPPTLTWYRDDEAVAGDDLVAVETEEGGEGTESRMVMTEAHPRHESTKYKVVAENAAGSSEREFGVVGRSRSKLCWLCWRCNFAMV